MPPLREVIRRHGLTAKKSLGQNFLLDLNLTARIARAAGPLEGVTVVEIGPGPGGLTRALLAQGAAARRSRSSATSARSRRWPEIAAHYPGRLTIVAGDALDASIRARICAAQRARIVANLPYNIATALLVGWLTAEPWPPWYDRLVLMFQREVAERIVAKPGSKTYGRLVGAGGLAHARREFCSTWRRTRLRAAAEGDVVGGAARSRAPIPLACDARALQRVTEAAFGQRRKMLRQSLKSLGVDTAGAARPAPGIEPTARAEDIPVDGFVRAGAARSSRYAHMHKLPR